jgi:predicted component of type VI protein secretion system
MAKTMGPYRARCGVHPKERLKQQQAYSQPMGDGSTRALVLRLNQSEDEKEEMKELVDLKRYHDKSIQRRLNKILSTRTSIMPRHSIANSLLGFGMN